MSRIVEIDYTNWRGERRKRMVQPVYIKFRSTSWHPEEQWLLFAVDMETKDKDASAFKAFAMKDIHSWTPQP